MNHLRESLSQHWHTIQSSLFPSLEEELDPLTKKQQKLVTTLEFIRVEDYLNDRYIGMGRPAKSRAAIARAFIAKMVYNMPTTRFLLERLESDKSLRRICGWEYRYKIPHESVFSRAFQEFSSSRLAERAHEVLIQESYKHEIIGHVSRDSTPIHAREKATKKEPKAKPVAKKRGRPKKGEKHPKKMTRIERQAAGMSVKDMLADLPKSCDVGKKQNSKGHYSKWIGYKLHIDAADGGIPITCILSSASMHDSQAAIPMAEMTNKRVTSLYDLMDSAYDVPAIRAHSRSLGHIPIIDPHPRGSEGKRLIAQENKASKIVNFKQAEQVRYHERTTVERVNARLKDEFGGRNVRVRGNPKVMCHLMLGILALTADQLMRMIL
jgi:hypothetical protein